MIIWEEYRLHAIIFTLRCFSVFAFAFICPESIRGDNAEGFLLFAMVMIHHLVVDRVTAIYGTSGQTTVRVANKDEPYIMYTKYFYAFYQFAALGSHLLPTAHLPELGFNTLIAIQSSAFLMTLFRKGLINWYSHALWYTACLALSEYHMARLFGWSFFAQIAVCFFARTRLRMNKYLIWATFCLFNCPGAKEFFQTRDYEADYQNAYQYTLFASKNLMWKWGFDGDLNFDLFDFTLTSRAVMLFGLMGMGMYHQREIVSKYSKGVKDYSKKYMPTKVVQAASYVKKQAVALVYTKKDVDDIKEAHEQEVQKLKQELAALKAQSHIKAG